ncbi:mitotic checkpoint protein BUB3.3-like isoform X1 [Panicum virgatum]|uniref:mitotic checkpoint protein BUB3.3-like isoform X1 n=1 Tax=Panicum virgatum TaxID=38727 RepID=UPI0019D565EB|nr:mitotic checkpoint protein BUB3.3-like isoform X1 [Panicum virgatum]
MARRSLAGGATAGAASRVRFAPTSNNLLVSSWDSGLRLYDADRNTLRFKAESEPALLDCCFEDESAAFACCSDGSVRRYDFRSVSQDTMGLHDDAVSCIEYSQTTGQIVTGSLDKKLQLWDTKTKNFSCGITFDSDVSSLSVCGMYISVAVARNVYFYDMRNLTGPVKAKFSPLEYHIRCLQSSLQWNGYVAGSVDGVVALNYLDDVIDGNMGYAFRCHPNSRSGRSNLVPINCIAIHPCKKIFVTGDDGGYAIAWDAQSKKKLLECHKSNSILLLQFPSYSSSVASMAYNHSGQLLAVAPNYYHEVDTMMEEHQIFIEAADDFKRKPHVVKDPSNQT